MRKLGYLVLGTVVAGCLFVGSPATATVIPYASFTGTVIDFDNLSGSPTLGAGEVLTNQYAGQGVTFSVPNFNAYATNGVLATGSTFTSLPNVIWVDQCSGGCGSLSQGMDINFATPQTAVGLFFELSSGSTATLAVYNGGTLIESVTSYLQPGGPVANQGFLALQDPNITGAVVFSTNSIGVNWNFVIDNLKYSAVPEPGTLILLGSGVLGAAGVIRRRTKM